MKLKSHLAAGIVVKVGQNIGIKLGDDVTYCAFCGYNKPSIEKQGSAPA